MDINVVGLCLGIGTLLLVGLFFILHPRIKTYTNHYYFWAICGAFLFIFLVCFRFWDDWSAFIEVDSKEQPASYITSKAWLLDMCPFAAFSMSVLMIVDQKRKILSIIAPFAIFGGLITIFGELIFVDTMNDTVNATFDWKWIVLGENPNEMYFSMHFLLVVFGSLILLNTKVKPWRLFLYCGLFFGAYMLYILTISSIYNVTENTTGLRPYDWIDGEYSGVASIMGLEYPYVMIVGYSAVAVIIFGLIFAFYGIQKTQAYSLQTWRHSYAEDPFGYWPDLYEQLHQDNEKIRKYAKTKIKH